MNRVLALDTSLWWDSLALVDRADPGGIPRIVAEFGVRTRDSHARNLLRRLEQLLVEADWNAASIDAFVATRGPGSFTGIRIGLGTIRGLGLATERPCLGVTTLAAIVEDHGPADRDRVALISAGRGEVYAQRFDPAGSPPLERAAPWLGPAESLAARIDGTVLVSAEGSEADLGRVASAASGAHPARPARALAAAAGRLALLSAGALETLKPSPLYLRPPEAEFARS